MFYSSNIKLRAFSKKTKTINAPLFSFYVHLLVEPGVDIN